MRGEIVLRFHFQHFEAIENGLGGSEIDVFLPGGRMGNLPQKQSGILCLEKQKVVETRIGLWIVRHGCE